jgi:chemosensory pili system protein ChpA (sensor histidine kinase/response regulator)
VNVSIEEREITELTTGNIDESVESREETLRWLMEMDRDEPEETLFKVEDAFVTGELSTYEIEVASRPLVRGRADADDLATYVEEEIVISSEVNGIYPVVEEVDEPEPAKTVAPVGSVMPVDYSQQPYSVTESAAASASNGIDILGVVPLAETGMSPAEIRDASPQVPYRAEIFEVAIEEAEAEELPVEPVDNFAVFDESIFEPDTRAELFELVDDETTDIDAVFKDIDELWEDDDQADQPVDNVLEPAAGHESVFEPDIELEMDPVPIPEEPVRALSQDAAWCIPEGIEFSYTSSSGAEIFDDFLEAFLEEGSVELEKLEDAVAAWEVTPQSDEAYTSVNRTLHTLKGIARGVGLQFFGTYVHNFETLLAGMARPAKPEESDYFRIVNAWLDGAVRGLEFVRENRTDVSSELPVYGGSPDGQSAEPEEPAVEATKQAMPPTPEEIAARESARADRKMLDKKLADEGVRVLAAQQSVRITSDKLDHLLNLANQAQQLGVRTAQSNNRGKRANMELHGRLTSVRAHLSEITDRALFQANSTRGSSRSDLDALEMDRYSELHEVANILREGVEDLADLLEVASRQNGEVETLLKQQLSVLSSIGSSVRAARVVPVSRLMPGLRRLVRTVSSDLGRHASFEVLSEVGTLDRDDYARCQIILEHMVRNALDHGIEAAKDRKRAGKDEAGSIAIEVRQSGGNTRITLSDDGRGIDPVDIRRSAVGKGIDLDVDQLADEEALRLIFHKGFSTASKVSEISGRGVGMDIVLNELQQMGGDIRIESTPGQGTCFHICIPSNVAVHGALLVGAGQSSYAIPLGGLMSVEHIPADEFFAAVDAGETLQLAETDCEPAYLGSLCQGEPLPERKQWGVTVPVIVAGSQERSMAIAIDHVEEALELVIRTLGPQFAEVPGVAGAATTADGQAVVALDLNLLVEGFASDEAVQLSLPKSSEEPLLALVVDDSRTQRKVTTSQLETVGVEALTAENGAVAIDLLNSVERLPDIVLLDVEMPIKDGIQTLREIRKSLRYSNLPVIMITSRTGLKHRMLAQQAGCDGYMGKPFHFPMLVTQINELTGHRLQPPGAD